jgi:hypothetical protein
VRPPRGLAARRVNDGAVEEAPISAECRAHWHSLNLEKCAAIRRVMEGRSPAPDVQLIVPEFGGPPSLVIEQPVFDRHDVAGMDRQARDSTGKYSRKRRKQLQV